MTSDDVRPETFVELLSLASPSLDKARAFLSTRTHARIPSSSYVHIWAALTSWHTKARAAELVFDLALHFHRARLEALLHELDSNGQVEVFDDDLALVLALFFEKGTPRKPGKMLAAYMRGGSPRVTADSMRVKRIRAGLPSPN